MKIISFLLATLLLSACAVTTEPVVMRSDGRPEMQQMTTKMERNIRELTSSLLRLGPNINRAEAIEIAHDAYTYPLYLADKWDLTWPPMFHNTLRNANYRKKGLCTDWADAMVTHMRRKNLKTFDIYWGVAFRGNAAREHSTLIVTAKGQPFSEGIILDPWRNSGRLYWIKHTDDPVYPWVYYAGPYTPLAPLNPKRRVRRITG